MDEFFLIFAAAPGPGVWGLLWDILVLLALAMALGTIADSLGQSVIVGYLVAGALAGPNVLGLIPTQDEIFSIAELGVALLLFAIGLEFSPRRLMSLGTIVLKTGSLQVVLTTALGFGGAMLFGLEARESLVIGMMVAVSSTACVLRLLTDRVEVDTEHGRMALGILLVQDAAVIPMILLIGVMSGGGSWGEVGAKLGLALILAAVLIGFFYLAFGLMAPRLLQMTSWRRNRDLPVLLAVIMAAGSAWATHALGLSPALGAFVAGVLLAASPFAVQIRADTRPLTTLMVTLFFAAIGMFADPIWLIRNWAVVLGIGIAIIVGKPLIIAILARVFGRPWRYGLASALVLAQVGEFSFVLAILARGAGDENAIMGPETFRAMVAATIVTLLLTPYLVAAAPKAGARVASILQRPTHRRDLPGPGAKAASESGDTTDGAGQEPVAAQALTLIIGFGPAGQRAAEGLVGSQPEQLVAIDLNLKNTEVAHRMGLKTCIGDATHRDVLEHAGIHCARAVVIALPDHTVTRRLIHLIRDLAPDAFIVARCRYRALREELLSAGAHEVVDEEDQLGRRLAAQVRRLTHVPEAHAD